MDKEMGAMTMKRLRNTGWIDVQRRTFTGWVNEVLKVRDFDVEVLQDDFDDGIMLVNMYELLVGEDIPQKYNKKPKIQLQKLENLTIALDAFKEEGLKIINIDSKSLIDGDDKLILGLIWSLILRYQIAGIGGEADAKNALLLWVQNQLKPYPVDKVTNFKSSWADGGAITCLVDSLSPGINPLENAQGRPLMDITNAMCKAEDNFEIPMLLQPDDMEAAVDELSCMTYISYYRDYVNKHGVEEYKGADASKSSADGPGLESGKDNEAAHFTVTTRTEKGDLTGKGGDLIEVKVYNANDDPCEVEVVDNDDGTYSVAYAAENPGDYEISVTVNGEHVPGSIFHVTIKEGAQPDMMFGTFTYTVQATSKTGNKLTEGGDDWNVQIRGPNDCEIEVKASDNEDGTYSATYELQAVEGSDAEFVVNCKLNGKHIGASPFKHRLGPKPSPFQAFKNTIKEVLN